MATASEERQDQHGEQHPAAREGARRACWREGGLPAGLKGGRKREGKEARERSSPFLLAAPKNVLLYNQKRAPNISHLCFFILSFGDQGGSHTEKRGAAVPKAAPRHEVLQDEQAGENITKNIV